MRARPLSQGGLWLPIGELRTEGSSRKGEIAGQLADGAKLSFDGLPTTAFLTQRQQSHERRRVETLLPNRI